MSEAVLSRPRRAARVVSFFAPGLPQLAQGRWGAGGTALLAWLLFGAVVLFRPARLAAAFQGGWEGRVAAATVVAGLVAAWVWSWRDARYGARAPRGAVSAFARNHLAVAGAMAVLLLYGVALVAPLLVPFDPLRPGALPMERLLAPSAMHLLGTDAAARDVFSRLLYGARVSLGIGLFAVAIGMTLGTLVGAVAGYVGGWLDGVLTRFIDMVLAFPRLVLLVTVVAVFDPSVPLIVLVLGLTLWPSTARLVRGEVLALREREFVDAARSLGYRRRRIILRHVVPNVLAPVIVAATLGIGDTIVLEAGLSFLGLGVQPPDPSWGTMVADGRNNLLGAWWLTTFPGLAIVGTVLAFNLLGEGLREALDPKARARGSGVARKP